MDLLGAHVSVAGGTHTAFDRGANLGCASLQIFVKSPNRWSGKELSEAEVRAFREARLARPQPVIAHAAYLINLCSDSEITLRRSRDALVDELERCRRLGVDALVVHPGAHLGQGEEKGLDAIARSLDEILARVPAEPLPTLASAPREGSRGYPPGSAADWLYEMSHAEQHESRGVCGGGTCDQQLPGGNPTPPPLGPRLLLENTAGQGTLLGSRFEQLGRVLELVDQPARLGVCLDTCHAFAAGYDLSSAAGLSTLLEAIGATVGLERLLALHINDSTYPRGSGKDRHANIGAGEVGAEALGRIVSSPQLNDRPMVLETPLGDDGEGQRRDLEILRSMPGRATNSA